MKRFDMAFPQSVEEVSELLAEHPDGRLIAGGTALTVLMKEGVYFPDLLVNLRALEDDLRYVREADSAIHVGALATLRDVERHAAVREKLPTVVSCLEEIAGVRVRNSATIGGHLAHADANLDLPPVLAGLDAEVVLARGGTTRTLPLEDFILGYYDTALEADELITELRVPTTEPRPRGVYLKHRYFSEVDWPCVGVAAFAVDNGGGLRDVRVLLNSVSDSPVLRVDGIGDVVQGELTDEAVDSIADLAMEQAQPVDGLRGSAAYKQRMVGVFTRRALDRLRAGGGA